MRTLTTAIVVLLHLRRGTGDPGPCSRARTPRGRSTLDPDPDSAEWVDGAPRSSHAPRQSGSAHPGPADRDPLAVDEGASLPALHLPVRRAQSEARSRSTDETPRLWNWDVAEAFIGSDFERIGRYKEFQVSPQSEWVDLTIDRENPKGQEGMRWNSGYAVKGRIDQQAPHLVRHHAHSVCRHRRAAAREGAGAADRALSDRRHQSEEALRVAADRPGSRFMCRRRSAHSGCVERSGLRVMFRVDAQTRRLAPTRHTIET